MKEFRDFERSERERACRVVLRTVRESRLSDALEFRSKSSVTVN